jgi:toxin ParE1/3/4
MNITLHPEAKEDILEAVEYYQERGGNRLAQQLITNVERSIQLIRQHPRIGAVWLYGKHRLLVQDFPYSIIYTIDTEEIVIISVANQNRHQDYWKKRK